jgi:hypothetical protein
VAHVDQVAAATVIPGVGDEASDGDGAIVVEFRELLGVVRQLIGRLRRVGEARCLEHVQVVVQTVRVGQERQRALLALEVRVREGRLREDGPVDSDVGVFVVDVRVQVDPGAGVAEPADVVDTER